jgi:hypothetical protein
MLLYNKLNADSIILGSVAFAFVQWDSVSGYILNDNYNPA